MCSQIKISDSPATEGLNMPLPRRHFRSDLRISSAEPETFARGAFWDMIGGT